MKFKAMSFVMSLILIFSLASCNSKESIRTSRNSKSSSTHFQYSANLKEPSSVIKEEVLLVDEYTDVLIIIGKLTLDSGSVKVTLQANGTGFWSNTFDESRDFTMQLKEVKAGTECLLTIETIEVKNYDLELSSNQKLTESDDEVEK